MLRLGVETDTQDASGEILACREVASSDGEIREAILFLWGYHAGTAYVLGCPDRWKETYEMARQGIEVERNPAR